MSVPGWIPVKRRSLQVIILLPRLWEVPGRRADKSMGLYKRKKVWWYTVVYKSKRIQESTRTDNKKLAVRIYAKVLIDIQEGRWFENQAKKRTLKEMIERYEKEYTENKSYYQKARDKTVFKHFYAFLGESCTLEEIENKIGSYEIFRKSQGVKPA